LAEWGDRSQIATIALAAAKNPYGVTVGGCSGHCCCTGLAVMGGRMLAARISEKSVSFWGGIIFLSIWLAFDFYGILKGRTAATTSTMQTQNEIFTV
jgi:putative Ca2+/H+ antiporter (TMEM165/GDT1 family)